LALSIIFGNSGNFGKLSKLGKNAETFRDKPKAIETINLFNIILL